MGGFANLRELRLSNNPISDTLPDTWAAMNSLTVLELANADLGGTIPKSEKMPICL